MNLPVPALDGTQARFLACLAPLVDGKTLENSEAVIQQFVSTTGQSLQADLEQHAARLVSDSWAAAVWRYHHLQNGDSLPLSGNTVMQIPWQATQTGIKRVAYFVSALLQVHADYQSGRQIPVCWAAETDSQEHDVALCRAQQRILLGASRRPKSAGDGYVFNEAPQSSRHIVILYKGYAWQVSVVDEKGGTATPAQIDNAIYYILGTHDQEAEIAFTAPSLLPTEQACEVRAQMICWDENRQAWECIEQALFVLTLDDTHHNNSNTASTDAITHSGLWAYKPLNYICYFNDDRYYVHFERTWTDAGNIFDIVHCAQVHYKRQDCPRKNALGETLGITALSWHMGEQTRLIVKEQLARYVCRAESIRVRHAELTISDEERQLLMACHTDAVCQLLLQYAQYASFGYIRSTVQTIDMRHYAYGRLAYLRPVSEASVRLVKALHDGDATWQQWVNYVQVYLSQLAMCRRGEGIHNHLMALLTLGQADTAPLAADTGFRQLNEDFLTTASTDDHGRIGHIMSVPSCTCGFHISYTIMRNHLSLVLVYRRGSNEHIAALLEALAFGLKRLLNVLRYHISHHIR